MPRFRLLAGQHIGADKTQKPKLRTFTDPETGEKVQDKKYPSRTYKPGEIVSDPTDLVAKFGGNKFMLLGGEEEQALNRQRDMKREAAEREAEAREGKEFPDPIVPQTAQFPSGQVSSGLQATTNSPTSDEHIEIAVSSASKMSRKITGKAKAKGTEDEEDDDDNEPTQQMRQGEDEEEEEQEGTGREAKPLEDMNVIQLKRTAAQENIDISHAKSKADIVKAIEKARRGR